jgi:nitrate reductase (NAD(P)H)
MLFYHYIYISPYILQLDPASDIIIAFIQNNKLLTIDHGYPVRVIIPGYIGGRMIKWLTNIDLLSTISQDYYHFYDNRVLPPHVDADIANEERWWYKPEYICNELNINSAASSPEHDQQVVLRRGQYMKFEGYAYTGGGRKITSK